MRLTRQEDTFQPLDGSSEVGVEPGEVAYASGNEILTRHFVWKQSRKGLLDESTRSLFLARVHAELRAIGLSCSRKRVARLMSRARLRGSLRGRRMGTTYRTALQQAAPDLVESNFVSDEPDRLWVADITYDRSAENFVYLAFILDACSRRVVGWPMVTYLRTEIVVDALQMAIARRKAAPGLVHHSDRGCSTPRGRSARD